MTSVSTTVPEGGLPSLESRRAKNLEEMRFFTTTTVSLGLYTETVTAERNPKSVSVYMCVTEMCQISRVIFTHGLDGLHDLRHFIVDYTVQHAITHTVSVHNDARRQTFVVFEVGLQCS